MRISKPFLQNKQQQSLAESLSKVIPRTTISHSDASSGEFREEDILYSCLFDFEEGEGSFTTASPSWRAAIDAAIAADQARYSYA